ncbi:MAG TPA: ElyC/SanA/YdcF family protein [Thermoanaerobaculia bacterium]|nr:ElyC/SanA/YdcF family protein [Thermoanaerobaculia bacterium]
MLWLGSVLLLVATVVWVLRRRRTVQRAGLLAAGAVVAAALAVAILTWPSLLVLRKIVGSLLMPTSLLWLALGACVLLVWKKSRVRVALVAVWLAYTAAGSPWTAFLLMSGLERPYRDLRPLASAEVYDAVLVMGGGVGSAPNGEPELSFSGDRVRLAAALHAAGRARLLVTSGTSVDGKFDVAEATARVWRQMGVPADAIVRLPGPRNSAQEVAAYAELLRERGWERVALLTSARHLPRALALCRRHGLAPDPVPADFRAGPAPASVLGLIPDGPSFADVESALWEYLGLAATRLLGG